MNRNQSRFGVASQWVLAVVLCLAMPFAADGREVLASQLGKEISVKGTIGPTLGSICTVRFRRAQNSDLGYKSDWYLIPVEILAVNEVPLRRSLFIEFQLPNGVPKSALKDGRVYLAQGFETGEFRNAPTEAFSVTGIVSGQLGPFGFYCKFVGVRLVDPHAIRLIFMSHQQDATGKQLFRINGSGPVQGDVVVGIAELIPGTSYKVVKFRPRLPSEGNSLIGEGVDASELTIVDTRTGDAFVLGIRATVEVPSL